MTVSPMRHEESEEVALLIRNVVQSLDYYNERAKTEEIGKYQAAELRLLLEEDPLSVLVARDQHRIVGFCISKYDDGLIWLSWFGVDDAARGQGVGRGLLEALGNSLLLRNAHKVWCDTRTDNIRSKSVLERVGFRKLVELRNHWYGQDFFLWEWYP